MNSGMGIVKSSPLSKPSKKIGKPNVPGKTGFKTVENKALKEYGSEKVAKKVAGAVYQKIKAKG